MDYFLLRHNVHLFGSSNHPVRDKTNKRQALTVLPFVFSPYRLDY